MKGVLSVGVWNSQRVLHFLVSLLHDSMYVHDMNMYKYNVQIIHKLKNYEFAVVWKK